MKHDPVSRPKHYTSHPSGIEAIQITEHMNFCLGNAIKYLWRADEKDTPVEDLKKAMWYIQREVERREQGAFSATGAALGSFANPVKLGYGYDGIPYWWKPSWPTQTACDDRSCSRYGRELYVEDGAAVLVFCPGKRAR